MKHFKEDPFKGGAGKPGIVFDRIFSLCKSDGKIVIADECDGYFDLELSPAAAVEVFREAIQWIEACEHEVDPNLHDPDAVLFRCSKCDKMVYRPMPGMNWVAYEGPPIESICKQES